MAHEIFPPDVIARLSSNMDARLNELAASEKTAEVKWIHKEYLPTPMPEKELAEVEKAVTEAGQTPVSFWMRFKKAAHEELCEDGGLLNAQLKKFGDVSNEKVLTQFGTILAALGFSGGALQVLAFACGVAVVHVGVKAYCMEDGGKEGAK